MESDGTATSTDSAEPIYETIGDRFPAAVRGVRDAFAIVVAGCLGAIFWLAIMQEGNAGRVFQHHWTNHDFPDGLGNALGAADHARMGLYATGVLGIIVAILFRFVARFLPGKAWGKGITVGVVLYLVWGLVYSPLVDARQYINEAGNYEYLSDTIFGWRSGHATPISAAVAAIVTGIVIARVSQTVSSPEWWKPKDLSAMEIVLPVGDTHAPSLMGTPEEGIRSAAAVETSTPEALLELPEKRPEDPDESSR